MVVLVAECVVQETSGAHVQAHYRRVDHRLCIYFHILDMLRDEEEA